MFTDFWGALGSHGIQPGLTQWLGFLEALRKGLATSLDELYFIGRAVLCRSESDYDSFDLAFAQSFQGLEVPADLREKLEALLSEAAEREQGSMPFMQVDDIEHLLRELEDRLRNQKGQHSGGNHFIGTRGTSAFGHSGRHPTGIRIGGEGGQRTAIDVAMERRFAGYRGDQTLELRDIQVALKALRSLTPEGEWVLDVPKTVSATAKNAGDLEFVEQRERVNRLRVVLLMDAGGSMTPHARRVEQLFSAASRMRTFRSLEAYTFHNCVSHRLYTDIAQRERVRTEQVLQKLGPEHRLIFVGDACMAPYELFSPYGYTQETSLSGLQWLQRFARICPHAIWLNPDDSRLWKHPTVNAIGQLFPMYELTLNGLRDGVRNLRAAS